MRKVAAIYITLFLKQNNISQQRNMETIISYQANFALSMLPKFGIVQKACDWLDERLALIGWNVHQKPPDGQ